MNVIKDFVTRDVTPQALHHLGTTRSNRTIVAVPSWLGMVPLTGVMDADLEDELNKYGPVEVVRFFDKKASSKSKGYC
jgi:hypothetical protein